MSIHSTLCICLDISSLMYRSLYSRGDKHISEPVIYRTIKYILDIIDTYKPKYLAVGIDGNRDKLFRREIYPEYKANRSERPKEIVEGLEKMKEFFDIHNIKYIQHDLSEADDVIASVSTLFADKKIKTMIIGVDGDLCQLHSKYIRLAKPKKDGVKVLKTWTDVQNNFGKIKVDSPDKVRDYLSLVGDASDGIKGVKYIGDKTASKLIEQFGDLKTLYLKIDEVEGDKLRQRLIDGKEDAFLSRRLIKLKKDLDIGVIADFEYNYNYELAVDFLEKYNLEEKLFQKTAKIVNLDF